MNKEEILELIEDFLNESGNWFEFKEYLESKGVELSQFGLKDDD